MKPTDPDSPPHPADVDVKRKIAAEIEAHNRLVRVTMLGRALYNTHQDETYREDEWTRKARGGQC